ncbi:MAG: hypothetical protein ACJ746_20750 [Bryobacteraceae bacterium]
MNRRNFMRSAGAALATGRRLAAQAALDGWRTFELKTRVEVLKPGAFM